MTETKKKMSPRIDPPKDNWIIITDYSSCLATVTTEMFLISPTQFNQIKTIKSILVKNGLKTFSSHSC